MTWDLGGQHESMSEVLSPVKLLRCTKCSFTTYYNQSLQVHMYRKHELTLEEAKPFLCKLCGYRTNYRGNLQKHIRVHTGERPYRCAVCDKGFTTSSNLKMHSLRHHGDPQGPPKTTPAVPWSPTPPVFNLGPGFSGNSSSINVNANNPELMRQYYAHLVGQAFAQQGALIPMMQQAAMMHSLGQSVKTEPGVPGSMVQTDTKPVIGVDLPFPDKTPDREPDSCGMDNDDILSDSQSPNTGIKEESQDTSNALFNKPTNHAHASSSQGHPDSQAKQDDDENMQDDSKQTPESSKDDKTSAKAQAEDRRTSTSSAATGPSVSLDGAGPNDLDLSRSSERSTDKRSSDDIATSLLDDLVQKGHLYSCQYCNIYFPELSMYVFHKGCHGPDAPFQCNFCYETFNKFDFMAHFLYCIHSNRK